MYKLSAVIIPDEIVRDEEAKGHEESKEIQTASKV